jgi:rhomboid-like protein
MFQFNFSGVVRHLIILNILFFFGSYIVFEALPLSNLTRGDLAAFIPGSAQFQPWQMFTYMFMHASFMHLFFNMLMLLMFGPMVEMQLGTKRFLFYYLFCGVGAYFIYLGIEMWRIMQAGGDPADSATSMVGASGAIYGVLAAFMVLFPNFQISLIFLPIPFRAKYFILFLILTEWFSGAKAAGGNVAYMAHFGGALFGLILIAFWYRKSGGE